MPENIKLSIIMPLYNVADTLQVALDSIFMQKVNFNYEIIAVDDGSRDLTLEILEQNAKIYPQIKIIKHETNLGNAASFYDGLSASRGDYFSVLDGDDYYTVKYKIQKQVDFLDSDKENQYAAVSHKYLKVDSTNNLFDTNIFNSISEYNYYDFLFKTPYSHTTTYMYRNIFKNKVPDFFKEEYCRGDNPRTFFHILFTKGKIKFLDFVGSVYRYSNNGIWSKTPTEEQFKRNIWMYKSLSNHLNIKEEKELFLNNVYRRFSVTHLKKSNTNSKESYLDKAYNLSNIYAFKNRELVFKSLYKSTFIDSVCESIGYIEKISRGISFSNSLKTNQNNIMIAISKLTTTGGGVYYEIKDIIEMYSDKNVYILLTDLESEKEINEDVLAELSKFKNLRFVYGKNNSEDKIKTIFDRVMGIAPEKIYYYCGHNNVFLNTLIQSDISKNICVFSFDHGFSLGLDNSNYDCYITKRPSDYEMLKKVYGEKVIYIPCWNKDKKPENLNYIPFKNHDSLITASAAARFYKFKGSKDENYIDFVLTLLGKTRGKHVHIGPIDENILYDLYAKMKDLNIDQEKFVYIPWSKNLIETLYENCVDVFIEPFPTVSYKITLEVLSGGIPIISKDSQLRMQCADFFYKGNLTWKSKNEFIDKLCNLSADDLNLHSKLSRNYFKTTHELGLLKEYFIQERDFRNPIQTKCIDNIVLDISSIEKFFQDFFNNPRNIRKQLETTFIEKIFSITNIYFRNKCYRIITILGIHITYENKKKRK